MRAVFEVMGVTDIVAKSHGSTNPYNMVRATLNALKQLDHAGRRSRPSAARRSRRSSADRHAENDHGRQENPQGDAGAERRRHARVAPRHRARPRPAQAATAQSMLDDTPAVRGMINKVALPGARCSERDVEDTNMRTQHHQARPRAPSTRSAASVAASAPASARPRAAATRARSRAPAATTRSASKAARCRCSAACPSAASSRARCKYNAEVRLSDLAGAGRRRSRPADAEAAGLVGRAGQDGQGHQVRRARPRRSRSRASAPPRAPRRRSKRPAARVA